MSSPIPWFAALSLTLVASTLPAQNCGLRNTYRMVNSVNNVPACELLVDSGWLTTGPLATPGSNSCSNPQGCLSQGTFSPVSDYGYLHVQGAGSATTCSAGGVFLWVDEWYGAEPKAQFRDTLQVTSTTLPPGTPVQLLWTVKFGGYANTTSSNPSVSSYAPHQARLWCNWQTVVDTQSTGTNTAIFNTTVGSSVLVHGHLLATLREQGVQGWNATGSYAIDLSAMFSVVSMTPGIALTACSGASYDGLQARAQPVGVGCGAVPPSLTATAPVLGGSSLLSMVGAPPNQPVVLALAVGPAIWAPVGPCVQQVDGNALFLLEFIGAGDAAGNWAVPLAIPYIPAWAGAIVTAQALPVLTNGPFLGLGELTNGVELRLGY